MPNIFKVNKLSDSAPVGWLSSGWLFSSRSAAYSYKKSPRVLSWVVGILIVTSSCKQEFSLELKLKPTVHRDQVLVHFDYWRGGSGKDSNRHVLVRSNALYRQIRRDSRAAKSRLSISSYSVSHDVF